MKLRCQLAYNYNYNKELMDYLKENKYLIHSVYFGFNNGSRPLKNDNRSLTEHLKSLATIKNNLDLKLAYVLNSVIPVELNEVDKKVLASGIVDIVTIARDDVYNQVKTLDDELNLNLDYELSRFYNYIKENNNLLKKVASISVYGFEHEIKEYLNSDLSFNINTKCFILNEHCYPHCTQKLKHNTNVILRNLGKTDEKFSCPHKDIRRTFTSEEIDNICTTYDIDVLKICDRTMSDSELLELFKLWFPIFNNYNLVQLGTKYE